MAVNLESAERKAVNNSLICVYGGSDMVTIRFFMWFARIVRHNSSILDKSYEIGMTNLK